jgi:hypothetical protein
VRQHGRVTSCGFLKKRKKRRKVHDGRRYGEIRMRPMRRNRHGGARNLAKKRKAQPTLNLTIIEPTLEGLWLQGIVPCGFLLWPHGRVGDNANYRTRIHQTRPDINERAPVDQPERRPSHPNRTLWNRQKRKENLDGEYMGKHLPEVDYGSLSYGNTAP